MRKFILVFGVSALVFFATDAIAGVPQIINYQGRLTDDAGNPLDVTVSMEFVIYDDSTGGVPLWTEVHPAVTASSGTFSVMLGTMVPIDDNVFTSTNRWLGITVGADPEISPRTKFTTVPYAFRVSTVDRATGGLIIGDVSILSDERAPGDLNVAGKATIGPGHTNTGTNAFVAGASNTATGPYTTVTGVNNSASGDNATVGGGSDNTALGPNNTIAGGANHTTSGTSATVGGGWDNEASNSDAVVSGGARNTATGSKSAISGGESNQASGGVSTVGGGELNVASGDYSTVGGGFTNSAISPYSTVGGGVYNTASMDWATVGGGYECIASGLAASVGGGYQDSAIGLYSTVGGGEINKASGEHSTVSGGCSNLANNFRATVSGGCGNTSSGHGATIGGGASNTASYDYAVIAGGDSHIASGERSAIGGGRYCRAHGQYSVVSGGGGPVEADSNSASGDWSVIAGGKRNITGGNYTAIAGGEDNIITGAAFYSMIFGRTVYLTNSYRIALFDGDDPGRLGINRDDNEGGLNHPIHVGTNGTNGNGAYLTGGGVWTNASSREFKENFQTIGSHDLLSKISTMPIESWNYKNSSERHIGPVAEDFVEAFDVGTIKDDGMRDNNYLSYSDVAGVALAGVKELITRNQELETEVAELKALVKQLLDRKK